MPHASNEVCTPIWFAAEKVVSAVFRSTMQPTVSSVFKCSDQDKQHAYFQLSLVFTDATDLAERMLDFMFGPKELNKETIKSLTAVPYPSFGVHPQRNPPLRRNMAQLPESNNGNDGKRYMYLSYLLVLTEAYIFRWYKVRFGDYSPSQEVEGWCEIFHHCPALCKFVFECQIYIYSQPAPYIANVFLGERSRLYPFFASHQCSH